MYNMYGKNNNRQDRGNSEPQQRHYAPNPFGFRMIPIKRTPDQKMQQKQRHVSRHIRKENPKNEIYTKISKLETALVELQNEIKELKEKISTQESSNDNNNH